MGKDPWKVKWLVKIWRLDMPNSKEFHTIHVSGKEAVIQYKVPVILSEPFIQAMENAKIETEIALNPEMECWGDKQLAEKQNPGMEYVERDGRCYLTSYEERFVVQRMKPMYEEIEVPPSAVGETVGDGLVTVVPAEAIDKSGGVADSLF